MNEVIREEVNPEMEGKPEMAYGSRVFRLRDRVIQLKNNGKMILYNRQGTIIGKGVFNGDVGFVREIRPDTVMPVFYCGIPTPWRNMKSTLQPDKKTEV